MLHMISTTVRQDFAFKTTNTRYSTHCIHPYVASMVPALAAEMIKRVNPKKLLDPFSGGGAVCVEGILAEIPTTGLDINLLSRVIGSAKTTWVKKSSILDRTDEIINDALHIKPSKADNDERKRFLIDYWFQPDVINKLEQISTVVNSMKQSKIKTLFQCILSTTVRDSMLTYRNEIRLHKLKSKDMIKFNPDVFMIFKKRAIVAATAVSSLSEHVVADIRHGSILEMPFHNNEFTTIICSPPYGDERNGVSYTQFSKIMLYWLGVSKSLLDSNKKRVLGWHNKESNKILPTCTTLKRLSKIIKNQQNKTEFAAFYHDYDLALKEMVRVTSDQIVIVIGNRVLDGHVINNSRITIELLDRYGIKLVNHYTRDLPSKRIPRFGKISNVNGGCIDREDVLIFTHR